MNGKTLPLKGFMLLPPSPTLGYHGIDRNPFEPVLLEEEFDPSAKIKGDSPFWTFYPPGWRRNAYRIYEENLVEKSGDDLFLISNLKAAIDIQKIIEPHIGLHEIVECEISELGSAFRLHKKMLHNFLGYDAAYPGGDFYSAVLNGLWRPHDRSHDLTIKYGQYLNAYGLFDDPQIIPPYIQHFKKSVQSEANSTFCIFQLVLQL